MSQDDLKLELYELLDLAKQNPSFSKSGNGITIPSFYFVFDEDKVYINYDADVYPEVASKMSILIWEFCKKNKLECVCNESYFNEGEQTYFGREAITKQQLSVHKELATFAAWERYLQKTDPEDLHSC